MNSLAPVVKPFSVIWAERQFIISLLRHELNSRYAGSLLGWGWAGIQPIMLILMYIFVYVVVLQIRLPELSTFDYIMTIFAGLVPWIGLSQSAVASAAALIRHRQMLKNTMFPIHLAPVTTVLANIVSQVFGMAVLLILLAGNGNIAITWVLLPFIFGLQILFLLGLGWLLSVITFLIRDVEQLLNIVFLFLMFVSPIAYTPDMVPHQLRIILLLNPLTYMINMYRDVLVYGKIPAPFDIAVFSFLSFSIFVIGYTLFMRARYFLVDYL